MNSLRLFVEKWWATLFLPERGRHGLLLSCTFGAGCIALTLYFLSPTGRALNANLFGTVVFWMLALLVPLRRLYVLLCNLMMLTSVLLMTHIANHTGGINSPALVWVTILVVLVLLLLGRRWAQTWLTIFLLIFVGEWVGVGQGWIAGDFVHSPRMVAWAFLEKVMMVIALMVVVNFYDRTHRHQMQAAEHSNKALEDAQEAIIQTQSHKDEFIASVGHELRAPMSAILGLNEVLQAELEGSPDQLQIAQHIHESTEQLLRLINDILDFSQLEAGRLSLQEKSIQMRSFLHDLLAPFQTKVLQKSLSFSWEVDPKLPAWIWVDPVRLRQLLLNLLENAHKFTHRGGIKLVVKVVGDMFRIEVQDSGKGIALDRQSYIFNRFDHADVQTLRNYGGAGLGLAICEKLVKLHGGRIGVQSAVGQGALFWFELPLIPAEPTVTVLPTTKMTGLLRFLLVDDNALNLLVAKLVLQKVWPSAVIQTAGGGRQALSLLETQCFDVVLMDMVMPDMNGIETTRQMRRHLQSTAANTPVIGLTASNNPYDKESCLHAGMNEVLVKPIDERSVRDVVKKLLSVSQSGVLQ